MSELCIFISKYVATKNNALTVQLICFAFQREDKVKATNEKCHRGEHQGLHGLVQELGREHGPDEEVVAADYADEAEQEQLTALKESHRSVDVDRNAVAVGTEVLQQKQEPHDGPVVRVQGHQDANNHLEEKDTRQVNFYKLKSMGVY